MKYSLVVTVFNEEKNIVSLLDSVAAQSVHPHEVVIVDGGSKDKTVSLLRKYSSTHPRMHLKVFSKKGNRSIGRNLGVSKSTGDRILFTDAGCILDKNWVREISQPFYDKSTEVVAGYYRGRAKNSFQQALIPYALVMPDRIDKKNFLPATRSMAIRKDTFNKLGGFEHRFSHNEDYVFANKIKESGIKISFARKAIAIWIPRSNLSSTFRMFFRFALGDIEAGIVRGKVLLIFARYFLLGYLLILSYLYKNPLILLVVILSGLFYLFWSHQKHKQYLKSKRARFYSLIIQLVSDISVMTGSFLGAVKYLFAQSIHFLKNNRLASVVLFTYICLVLSLIGWGLPSNSHPFIYHMDEWHFLNAIRSVASIGDPNVEGSAHTAMFYPFSSGIFLIPFILLKIINPFAVQSPFSQFEIQQRIFEILRLHTLVSGIVATTVIILISKYFLKIPSVILVVFLAFAPVFLSLSNFYKYDITLLSLTILGCLLMFTYSRTKKIRDFYLGSFVWGLAFATKFTAIPLFALIMVGYFLFTLRSNWKLKEVGAGLGIFSLTFMLFGIPNLFFGKGNLNEYFYSNLVSAPGVTSNIIFPYSFWGYMLTKQLFGLFGIGLSSLIVLSIPFYLFLVLNSLRRRNLQLYSGEFFSLAVFLIFLASIVPLKVAGGGNRSLVVMSGALLIVGYFLRYLFLSKFRGLTYFILPTLLFIQIIQGYSWVSARGVLDPRQSSSRWISSYIEPATKIGIENIPIYQYIPDIALREFYASQERGKTRYDFEVIDASSKVLPKFVIISHENISKFIKSSPKNDLLLRLEKEDYIKVAEFETKPPLFMDQRDFFIANIGPVFPVAQIAIFKKD